MSRTAIPNFRMIQALRAIAALLVVLLHCTEMWDLRIDGASPGEVWQNGAAGVDIFFVISGFIMTVSTRGVADAPLGWLTFLKNRVVRIVPLYWIMTALKFAAVMAAGGVALRSQLTPGFVTESFAFLPLVDSAGHFRPLLPVGWTLTFEFLFYFAFAFALACGADAMRVVLPVLGLAAVAGFYRGDDWPVWTVLFDPIVLEFVFGIAIAKLMLASFRLTPWLALFVMFAGFAVLFSAVPPVDHLRVVMWGLPAALVVAGAVSLERELGPSIPAWLLKIGDASYSLYLSHGFFLAALGASIHYLGWSSALVEGAAIPLGVAGSVLIALAVYRGIEKPLLRLFKSGRPRTAVTAT